jgi:UDP-4-amino-4,6-dideoxy-N-acetyl-beta-L-altrosamine transaminase
MIPYGRQDITPSDVDAVLQVLKSEFLTQGPVVPIFEQAIARHVGARDAIAVNSATSALHIACLSLGLGPGDWFWTSPVTFVASANCGLYCGAQVDFVDIHPKTYNLCPVALKDKLVLAKRSGTIPKVLIAVHLSGQSCDMAAIQSLSHEYGFKVIEDASHAIGGRYKEKYIGSGIYSDITVFSFHPVKIITTAEGGMALTNNPDLAHKMRLYRSHGITRDAEKMTRTPEGPWYYQQVELGYNYRMSELQAALGVSQMQRLDTYVAQRNKLADRYDLLLSDLPVVTPWRHPDCYSSFHLYLIRLELEKTANTHLQVFQALRSKGIGVNVHYIPVHLQPFYQRLGFRLNDFPRAERYYNEAISLPIYPGLTEQYQNQVVVALRDALT